MSTTGHENEAINVQGLKASLQKFKDEYTTDVAYLEEDDSSAVIADFDPQTDTVWKKAQTLSNAEKSQVKTNLGLPQEIYSKTEVNNLITTPNQQYVTVATYASLPASGSADTIYRVSNYNGSTSQVDSTMYSEYAWNGTDYEFLCVKSQIGEVFDITAYNSNTKYADLAAALGTNGANVPEGVRKGGMSVKYVSNSDNKYVQYTLSTKDFSINPDDWICSRKEIEELSQITTTTVASKNLLNIDTLTRGLLDDNGVGWPDDTFNQYYSDYIPVNGGDNIIYSIDYQSDRHIATLIQFCQFDENKQLITHNSDVQSILIESDTQYIRISLLYSEYDKRPQLEKGTEISPYEQYFAPYKILKNQQQVNQNTADISELKNKTDDINDELETLAQITTATIASKNLLNINAMVRGWLGNDGVGWPDPSANQYYSDYYIAVNGSDDIIYSVDYQSDRAAAIMILVCQFNENKQLITYNSNVQHLQLESNTKYIKVAINSGEYSKRPQVEIGTEISSYEDYFKPYEVLKNQPQVNENTAEINSLDSEVFNKAQAKGVILLNFDDTTNWYANRYALVKGEFGFNATIALNTAMTSEVAQNANVRIALSNMFANGWDYAQYGGDNYPPNENTATVAEFEQSIKSMMDRFKSYGFFNPVVYFAVHNFGGDNIITALQHLGFRTLRTQWLWGTDKEYIKGINKNTFKTWTSGINDNTLDDVKAEIDRACANGWGLSIMTHQLKTTGDDMNCSIATYRSMLEYIQSKVSAGVCEVLTYREYYNRYMLKDSIEIDWQRNQIQNNFIMQQIMQ